MEGNASPRGNLAVMGVLIAIGLILGGWILGAEIKQTRLGDRYVSVKGLSERTVKSDLAATARSMNKCTASYIDKLSGV